MLWLGLLSIVQVAFLPGYLALWAVGLNEPPRRTLVLSFALSLVINHFLVVGLVLLGCYRPGVIYGIFAAELAALAWTARRWPMMRLAEVLPSPQWDGWRGLLSAAACLLMAGLAAEAIYHAGDIFREWDAVVSWNRWAIGLGGQPACRADTAEYPQLLPSEFVAELRLHPGPARSGSLPRRGCSCSTCFCFLAMFDLGCETGAEGDRHLFRPDHARMVPGRKASRVAHLLGLFITYALLVAVLRFRFLSSGYADMPVAFMAFAGVYALLFAREAADAGRQAKYVLLGAILCDGAA